MNFIKKKGMGLGSFLAFLLSFLCFIWAPVEFYWSNKTELWFQFFPILKWVLVFFASLFVAIVFILLILEEKPRLILIAGLFAVILGVYLQGNWINADYGVLNGASIVWDNYNKYGVINTLVWVGLIFVSILSLGIFKYEKWAKVVKYISCGLLGMLLLTMFTLFFIPQGTKEKKGVVTNQNRFVLGTEENTVVFVLDSMDSNIYSQVLEEDKENYEFEDFTWYSNMAGMFPTTEASMPYILTGELYRNQEPYDSWIENAYGEAKLYQVLKEKGYNVGLYVLPDVIARTSTISLTDNISDNVKSVVSDEYGLSKKFMDFIWFRYMPHHLKKNFVVATEALDVYKSDDEKIVDDVFFYKKLVNEGISVEANASCFRVYHLKGSHPPFIYDENINLTDSKDMVAQTKGALNIVKEYIRQLKEKGIYDQTNIVICADHGSATWSELSQSPTTLIKRANESHAFVIDNTATSYAELNNSLISLVDGDMSRDTIWDNAENPLKERSFFYYALEDSEHSKEYMPIMYEYIIGNTTKDIVKGSKIYYEADVEEIEYYSVDSDLEIDVIRDLNNIKLFDYGTQYFAGDYRWTVGKETALTVSFLNKDSAYKMDIYLHGTLGKQKVKCAVGEQKSEEMKVQGEVISVLIPKEVLQEPKTQIKLEWPDAQRASDLRPGCGDFGMYAVQMTKIVFTEIPDEDIEHIQIIDTSPVEEKTVEMYELGTELSFKDEDTARKYMVSGFSGNEGDHTWTDENKAEMAFKVGRVTSDLELVMEYNIYKEKQQVIVSANGNKIEDYNAVKEEKKTIIIPAEYIEDGELHLSFELPNAVSPKSLGESVDTRKLALAMKTIKISAVSE